MTFSRPIDFAAVRDAMASFELSPRVEPNEKIEPNRAFFPAGHRGVLDMRRQLVVGNRGMGKSFWTHALHNAELRERLARVYSLPALANTEVVIGFNGSERLTEIAPTTDEVAGALKNDCDPELIWRAVLLRAAYSFGAAGPTPPLSEALNTLAASPGRYAEVLTAADDALIRQKKSLLIVFDALDRLGQDWGAIRALTKGLLIRTVGLQSFGAIRAKIFMRVDQFADTELFRFPDSSKITNDRVDLAWQPYELYGLLLFELLRCAGAKDELLALATQTNTLSALPQNGQLNTSALDEQAMLVTGLAGEFMGGHKKRGRVYTWVPLHLGDADNNCSPRTFLTAWKSAAGHIPPPTEQAVDHLGLIDGVRRASGTRLAELREDYPWIDSPLEPLRRQFVPISREDLFALWLDRNVVRNILSEAETRSWLAPIDLISTQDPAALLDTMARIAVMEVRANGKINVPDIFRVEAEILRKGGVAVPRRH
jgi:hypothetical protein